MKVGPKVKWRVDHSGKMWAVDIHSHSDHQSECCLTLAVQTIISKSKRTEIDAGLEMKVQSIQLDKGENMWFQM